MRLIDSVVFPFGAWLVACSSVAFAAADLPMLFEQNRGQVAANVKFVARTNGFGVFLTESGAVLRMRGKDGEPDCILRLAVAGGSGLHIKGTDPSGSNTSYLMSVTKRDWRTDIPSYTRVKYKDVLPGIDLAFHGSWQKFEYDLVVAPGRHVSAIRLDLEGNTGLSIDSLGDLVVQVAKREIRQHRPHVYQTVNGATRDVAGDFTVEKDGRIGFSVGAYDHRRPLIIDPVIDQLAGPGPGSAIAVDPAGNIFVAGTTDLTDFPTTPGAVESTFNGATCNMSMTPAPPVIVPCETAFVYQLSADGSHVIYATYLGTGFAMNIAVDSAGDAYVTGGYNRQNSTSPAFPVTPGLPAGGLNGAFVTKLNPQGNAILYSAVLGDFAEGVGIAVDSGGNAYVAGTIGSGSFPTTAGAFLTASQQPGGFVLKINPAGTALVYSTLMGGNSITGLAVDPAEEAYVTGYADSSTLQATPGAFQTVSKAQNAFVAKLSADGSTLRYATFLGGTGADFGQGIAVDAQGSAYVTGTTTSADFPETSTFGNAVGTQQPGSFISKLSPAGDALVFSDLIGGPSTSAIAIDNTGESYAIGNGGGVPVTSNAESRCEGAVLLLEVSADGKTLLYSSFFGNIETDGPSSSLVLDANNNIYIPNSLGVWKLAPPSSAPVILPPCFSQLLDPNGVNQAPIVPGGLVVIDGFNMGPQSTVYASLSSSGRFPTTLGGTQVTVGGYPSPLLDVQADKIRFMAPFEIAGDQQAAVQVVTGSLDSDPVDATVAATAPAVIQLQPPDVSCQGAVLNQDGTANSSTNPAAIGSVISIFAEGAGEMNMPVVDGSLATPPLAAPLLPVKVWFQNTQNFATVYYAGSAPGLILGTLQVNVQIPTNVPSGSVIFGLNVGGTFSSTPACMYVGTPVPQPSSRRDRKAASH